MNDLLRLVAQAESGNRDYDAAGRVVTSPVGAKGRMQVMDATNRDPGFGVRPAADDSLEERARVGQDYLGAMVNYYGGDVRKGLAAYNAGPGNVDRALARAQQAGDADWMRYLPKPEETVPYVEKIVAGMRGQPGVLDTVAASVFPAATAAPAPDVDWNSVTWDEPAAPPAAALAKPGEVDWSTVQWEGADTPARSPDGALRVEMSQESNPAAAATAAQPTQAQKIQASAFGRMAQGAVVDPLNAGAQLLVNAAPGGVVDAVNSATQYVNELPVIGPVTRALGMTPATAQDVNQGVQQQEQQYQAARRATGNDGFDWARLSGSVAATAPLAAAMAPAAGLSVPASMATAAGSGAVFGGLQPVTEGGDYAENKLRQMAVGGVSSGALSGVGNALSRVISPRASVNPNVQTLLDEGVTPTPGQLLGGTAQRMEDKAVSIPIVGDAIRGARERGIQEFNEAALNRAVAPLGQRVTATGREGMQQVQRIVGDAYDDIIPRLNFRADNQFAQEIGTLQQMAQTLPPAQAQQFETILRDQVIGRLTRQGGATGQNYRAIESELGRLGANYRSSAVAGERELGMAITELQASLRETLTRSNPQVAQELASINQAYSMLTRLQRAASATGADEGVFTPAQFSAAVRAADGTVRKNAYARGGALMQDLSDAGRGVMNTTVPNSGTFDRAALVGAATLSAANPLFPVGLAAGALPYLRGPNRLAAALIARRPEIAPQLAERISGVLPAAGVVAAPALNQLFQP
ncbi:lytic transglycosylase domain-containing protein [Achromobacter sp. NFACC18-2]|uniref:lytic transglycosylase domain-containing protein n=1 Tax=Achromobacter sp. NFACC18-2 TaxID=1564112 RepID=UPI001C312538|nr:lytic transglycosylase domain-containing protein [Achromobacter sp. NFACC18-2]